MKKLATVLSLGLSWGLARWERAEDIGRTVISKGQFAEKAQNKGAKEELGELELLLWPMVSTEEAWASSWGQWAVMEGFEVAEWESSLCILSGGALQPGWSVDCRAASPGAGRWLWGSEEKFSALKGRGDSRALLIIFRSSFWMSAKWYHASFISTSSPGMDQQTCQPTLAETSGRGKRREEGVWREKDRRGSLKGCLLLCCSQRHFCFFPSSLWKKGKDQMKYLQMA